MEILQHGQGELLGWHDPDENREFVLHNKSRELKDKTMTAAEAVSRFVKEGDFIASGGLGHVRISMNIIYEMIRQKKHGMAAVGKGCVHDIDVMIAGGLIDRAEVSYSFGHELRGLSPAGRRAVESGKVKVVAETSNAGYQWRFLAGMMGIPFIPSRNLLGTDTFKYSSCKSITDPYSGKPVNLIPAAYPDVAFIHVHRCDKFGNCQIDGILVMDYELARCARKLIITTEEIVDSSVIRSQPWHTVIPYYVVDAVVEQHFGSHPCEMSGMYYFDEEHIAEYLSMTKSEEGTREYFDKYVHSTRDFEDYLDKAGGMARLNFLKKREALRVPSWKK
jgi:3-oxoacid CoA-transferase subunit A/glutaconate CoA-transferase subunit A